ncbi:hypothetical protein [Trinickia dinghuensis]|uniref:Uncharacterized protein n=1 Tax=Trinickia dinghuensis TaxID=2291023 RepID=A0A3D8K1K4_9BURK|nr:hypothetical protein [Trinickia dinghuensis]RDU98942.1 hypothetical protein DWV00_11920 [Trinickia dinghuensis]
MDEITRQYRDALRLLFILARAGDEPTGNLPVTEAVRVVWSEKKLQKMDFWVRNPDHFAYALLEAHSEDGTYGYFSIAASIGDSEEPEIRRDAMLKYLYGAYEPLDTALAPLVSFGLARMVRDKESRQRMYFLLPAGLAVADKIAKELPEARWYEDRTTLIGAFCKGKSGDELARWQYRNPSYSGAKHLEPIGSIAEEVRRRIDELAAQGA